jgi:cytochrome oxidase assembly protein ShyY1
MRRFFTPMWVLSHLFVVAMVVAMTFLGFWQLNRLDERKARNVEVGAAMEAAPRPIGEVLDTDAPEHTAVIARGEYLDEHSFLVANRTFEAQAGSWLATPMRLETGKIIVISRGWVPRSWAADEDRRQVETPVGALEVLGRLRGSIDDGRLGGGQVSRLPEISRLDIAVVEELTGLDVSEEWVQLAEQAPPLGALPIPVPRPGLDEGPHLSYAFQWFFFSTGTVVAYILILRKRQREMLLGDGA